MGAATPATQLARREDRLDGIRHRIDVPRAVLEPRGAKAPPIASPMGLAALGVRLYVVLFSGTGRGSEVVSMPVTGGQFTPSLVGFVSPVIAGDLTGSVYSYKP